MASIQRTCERCGTLFTPKGKPSQASGRRFCSRACANQRPIPVAVRFWQKVQKTGPIRPTLGTPCWLWTGGHHVNGYGAFAITARLHVGAHRWAYEEQFGPIPPGYELDHLCRTPACVNPSHLEVVTHHVNMQRGAAAQRTHCPHGHPYDETNTLRTPRGHRWCRACGRRRATRRYQITHG